MSKSGRVPIDTQIEALIKELEDRCFLILMMEHQRVRLFSGEEKFRYEREKSAYGTVKLSINDLVMVYTQGGEAHFKDCRDVLIVYEKLRQYLGLWVERSNKLPDEPIPSMEEFVNIDDYLAHIYPLYTVQAEISRRENNKPRQPVNNYRRRLLSPKASKTAQQTGFVSKRYQSLMGDFHEAVWRNQA